MMLDPATLDSVLIGGIAALATAAIATGAAGVWWWWSERKRPLAQTEPPPALDWMPTLVMDARADAHIEQSEDDYFPANWVLRSQEMRLVHSVSGEPNVEVRWRPSTRREVKQLLSTYRKAMAEGIESRAKLFRVPVPTQAASVTEEMQAYAAPVTEQTASLNAGRCDHGVLLEHPCVLCEAHFAPGSPT